MLEAQWDRLRTLLCFGAALGAGLACAPSVDKGCDADVECDRGEVCDIASAECVPKMVDVSSTENPAPPNFTAKPVPYFRGNVCTMLDVKAGEKVPIRLDPCFHPCLTSNSFHHKHYFTCIGNHCEAWAMMYVDAASVAAGCPVDAFGKFPEAMCVYDKPVDLSIQAVVDSVPVQGTLYLEVPFLSNADMAEIAPMFDNTDLITEKIEQYPQDPGRHVGGMDITLRADSPAPPASCADGACPCYKVGF